ncbi:MAG: hypothetical protein ACHQQQ_05200 [Bacteroidota bacterium]
MVGTEIIAQTMMRSKNVLTLLCVLICGTIQLQAQNIEANARVDSNNIQIGDWLKLHLEVKHPAGISVHWPSIADSLQGIDVLSRDTIHTEKSGDDLIESTTLTITSFDSGTVIVPPLPFQYSSQGDTAKKVVETSPIPIFVHTVAVDTSKDIKDIKPPLGLSITLAELLPYIVGIIVIGGLSWLAYYIWKKKQRGEKIIPEAPRKPPHELALNELRSIESEHIWQRGMIKEYHTRLTDILRVYIEGRFGVMAMEMTTDEVMASLDSSGLSKEMKNALKDILVRADFAKFAKFQPGPQENEESMKLAFNFVEGTWRKTAQQPIVAETALTEVKA